MNRRFFRQVMTVAAYDFLSWRGNARIFVTFALAFILCFLLTDKALHFADTYGTNLQLLEPFVWTFGDGNSILLASLLLLLLFSDMPFVTAVTPYYLSRTGRLAWILGQSVYIVCATALYMAFVFASCCVLCMTRAYAGNFWSETAAVLGYSGAGESVALPTLVKTLELSDPLQAAVTIFSLMLGYALLLASVMLFFTLRFSSAAGVVSVFGLSLFGFLLNPETFRRLARLEEYEFYRANVAVGWLSPLNHATYSMHNFGYDLLPRIWQSGVLFAALILLFCGLSVWAIRRYNFHFRGTEG